jgi:hypothetical protein
MVHAMEELRTYREAARNRGVPEPVIDWWLKLARRQAGLHKHGGGPVVGHFGGNPSLPADVEWPVDHHCGKDEPIPFVASIDCGALPPGALDIAVPEDGCLLFFTDYDDFNAGDSRVIYVAEGTPTAERAALYPEDTYGRFPLHYVPHWKLPEDEAVPLSSFAPDSLFHQHHLGGLGWEVGCRLDTGEMTLGGYVTKVQDDPRRDESWVLLAETSVGEDTFGEPRGFAIIHWIIPQEDLAEKRFDRVEAVKAQVH